MDKHFTATTYIFEKHSPLILLHWHKKLESWLPPGGHIEKNETPLQAALREVIEETGLSNIQFIHNSEYNTKIDDRCKILSLPHYLLEEEIEPGHYHLDWIFFAVYDKNNGHRENHTFKWFSIEELRNEKRIFENVRVIALKGIEMIYSNLSM